VREDIRSAVEPLLEAATRKKQWVTKNEL